MPLALPLSDGYRSHITCICRSHHQLVTLTREHIVKKEMPSSTKLTFLYAKHVTRQGLLLFSDREGLSVQPQPFSPWLTDINEVMHEPVLLKSSPRNVPGLKIKPGPILMRLDCPS